MGIEGAGRAILASMAQQVDVYRSYKYRLYRCDKRDKALHSLINVAGWVWNHALALQKRSYRLWKQHVDLGQMKAYIAKLRRKVARYARWQGLNSQSVQEVLERQ